MKDASMGENLHDYYSLCHYAMKILNDQNRRRKGERLLLWKPTSF
ncbi:MAG: hypothetical protein ACLU4J_25625 [Butyricimonas paravirosa]